MKVLLKLIRMLLVTVAFATFIESLHGSDNCHDQSASYIYEAVYEKNRHWMGSKDDCKDNGGCLARPHDPDELKAIQNAFLNEDIHGNEIYWVGIKYNIGKQKFQWDDGTTITNTPEFSKIINKTQQLSQNFNKRCLAATTDTKLEAVSCTSTIKFICQIPASTPGINHETTKEPKATHKPKNTKKPTVTRATNHPHSPEPKTPVDEMVGSFVTKMKKITPKDANSLEEVVNITTTLIANLRESKKDQNGHKKKGDFMKGATELEKFGMEYCKLHINKTDKSRDTIKRKTEGFVFEMQKIFKKPEKNLMFPEDPKSTAKTTIEIPANLFNVINESGVAMVSSLFTGVSDTLPTDTENSSQMHQLISEVISTSLYPKPSGILPENITITLEHRNKLQPSKYQPKCVYWKFRVDNQFNGTWSSAGCTVNDTNDIKTICSCNHMTSFALLMQVDDNNIDTKHKLALMYITYIGCSLSLVGEALTVLAYVLLMNMKQEQAQIRVNLAFSLAVAQIFFMSGITATEHQGVCTFVAAMIHFFYLVAFGWMMLEGVYLYLMVVKVFNTIIKMRLFYLFAWGCPMILVVLSIIIASSLDDGIKSYTRGNFCWVSFSNGLVWTFVAPVMIIILINMIILIRVVGELTRLNKKKSDSDSKSFKQGTKACVVLFPLLGLTWLFGILTVTDASLVFQYIFTILNSFQGFLIFILHVLRSGEIHSEFRRKLQRWETTRGTNFSSKSAVEHSISSTTDKNPLKQFASSDSLQDSFGRNNRVIPVST